MIGWKGILINGFVTLLVVLAVIKVFVPDNPVVVDKIQEPLVTQLKSMEERLGKIEDALPQRNVVPLPSSRQPTVQTESLEKVNQKLQQIAAKLSLLEQKIGSRNSIPAPPIPFSPPGTRDSQSRGKTFSGNSFGWIDRLPKEKREMVNMVFEENARNIREKMPIEPDGGLPDRETMKRIMREGDRELREELKQVLSEEEYQNFLESLPKIPLANFPNLPDQTSGGLRIGPGKR